MAGVIVKSNDDSGLMFEMASVAWLFWQYNIGDLQWYQLNSEMAADINGHLEAYYVNDSHIENIV